jgi:hypothetical protein
MQKLNAPQETARVETGKPLFFYLLMLFLTLGVSYIGWNFGGVTGAVIAFLFTCLVNGYAIQIKND